MTLFYGAYIVTNVILDWDCFQYVEVTYPQHKESNANPVLLENSLTHMTQPPAMNVMNV